MALGRFRAPYHARIGHRQAAAQAGCQRAHVWLEHHRVVVARDLVDLDFVDPSAPTVVLEHEASLRVEYSTGGDHVRLVQLGPVEGECAGVVLEFVVLKCVAEGRLDRLVVEAR